jgi:hypothetical protein
MQSGLRGGSGEGLSFSFGYIGRAAVQRARVDLLLRQ